MALPTGGGQLRPLLLFPQLGRCYFLSQNSFTASCSAFTLGNPRADAAASSTPNFRASAEMLLPLQFGVPGVPAKPRTASVNLAAKASTIPPKVVWKAPVITGKFAELL